MCIYVYIYIIQNMFAYGTFENMWIGYIYYNILYLNLTEKINVVGVSSHQTGPENPLTCIDFH